MSEHTAAPSLLGRDAEGEVEVRGKWRQLKKIGSSLVQEPQLQKDHERSL